MEPAGKREAPVNERAGAANAAVRTSVEYARLPLLALSIFALLTALWVFTAFSDAS
jgi:hypothetical protein